MKTHCSEILHLYQNALFSESFCAIRREEMHREHMVTVGEPFTTIRAPVPLKTLHTFEKACSGIMIHLLYSNLFFKFLRWLSRIYRQQLNQMNSRPQRNTYYKPSIAGQILPMLVAFVFVLFFSLPMIETVNAKQFQGTIIKQSAVEWHNTGKDDDSKSYYTQDDIVRVEMGHGDSIEVRIEAREDNESKLPQMGDTVTVMRSHQLISNSEVWRFGTVKKPAKKNQA